MGFDAPFYCHTVPEAERERRCTLTSDFCSIDGEDYFIRGCLEIPILKRPDVFAWSVWMSVSAVNFNRYTDVFDDRFQSTRGTVRGLVIESASDVPGDPDAQGSGSSSR